MPITTGETALEKIFIARISRLFMREKCLIVIKTLINPNKTKTIVIHYLRT